jgi:hypothetical protein
MMTVTLDTLELAPTELESRRDVVRRMAYLNWLNSGCPDGRQLDFWLLAEREWIEHLYLPTRPCDGMRPPATTSPAADSDTGGDEESPKGSRPREKAMV